MSPLKDSISVDKPPGAARRSMMSPLTPSTSTRASRASLPRSSRLPEVVRPRISVASPICTRASPLTVTTSTLPAEVGEVDAAAHRADAQPMRLADAAQRDVTAHRAHLGIVAGDVGGDFAAHALEPLRAEHAARGDIGADRGDFDAAALGHLHFERRRRRRREPPRGSTTLMTVRPPLVSTSTRSTSSPRWPVTCTSLRSQPRTSTVPDTLEITTSPFGPAATLRSMDVAGRRRAEAAAQTRRQRRRRTNYRTRS